MMTELIEAQQASAARDINGWDVAVQAAREWERVAAACFLDTDEYEYLDLQWAWRPDAELAELPREEYEAAWLLLDELERAQVFERLRPLLSTDFAAAAFQGSEEPVGVRIAEPDGLRGMRRLGAYATARFVLAAERGDRDDAIASFRVAMRLAALMARQCGFNFLIIAESMERRLHEALRYTMESAPALAEWAPELIESLETEAWRLNVPAAIGMSAIDSCAIAEGLYTELDGGMTRLKLAQVPGRLPWNFDYPGDAFADMLALRDDDLRWRVEEAIDALFKPPFADILAIGAADRDSCVLNLVDCHARITALLDSTPRERARLRSSFDPVWNALPWNDPVTRSLCGGGAVGAMCGVFLYADSNAARREAIRLMLLIQQYRVVTGRLPDSVEDLQAVIPHRPAVDAVSERPFKLRRTTFDERARQGIDFIVYSPGPDGIDDGGAPRRWSWIPERHNDVEPGEDWAPFALPLRSWRPPYESDCESAASDPPPS